MENFKCEFCDSSFVQKVHLERHQKSAKYCLKLQNKKVDTTYCCSICNKKFSRKDIYKRHLKIHGVENVKIFELEEEKKSLKDELLLLKKHPNKNNESHHPTSYNLRTTEIQPFTSKNIREILLPQYTKYAFMEGLEGILRLMTKFTKLSVNGIIEQNLVCTDKKRSVFYLLDSDRNWKNVDSIDICSKIINIFIPKMDEWIEYFYAKQDHYTDIKNQLGEKKTLATMTAKAKFNKYSDRAIDAERGFYGIIRSRNSDPDDYLKLIIKFRNILKFHIHIKSIEINSNDEF